MSIRNIILEEAAKAGVSYEDVVGPRRIGKIMKARRASYIRSREETRKSWNQIARVFNRDHTTVLDVVKKWSEHDPRHD